MIIKAVQGSREPESGNRPASGMPYKSTKAVSEKEDAAIALTSPEEHFTIIVEYTLMHVFLCKIMIIWGPMYGI